MGRCALTLEGMLMRNAEKLHDIEHLRLARQAEQAAHRLHRALDLVDERERLGKVLLLQVLLRDLLVVVCCEHLLLPRDDCDVVLRCLIFEPFFFSFFFEAPSASPSSASSINISGSSSSVSSISAAPSSTSSSSAASVSAAACLIRYLLIILRKQIPLQRLPMHMVLSTGASD